MRPRRHVLPIVLALVAGASCGSTAAWAQSAPAPTAAPAAQPDPSAPPANPDIVRLSDEQRNAILDANTEESAAAARGELTDGAAHLDRGVHGEVGMMIGSNGMRGAYGMADVPLGDNGEAMVAVESTQYGRRR